jgi:hypothetical protein
VPMAFLVGTGVELPELSGLPGPGFRVLPHPRCRAMLRAVRRTKRAADDASRQEGPIRDSLASARLESVALYYGQMLVHHVVNVA